MSDIIKYTNRCIRKYQQKGEKRPEKNIKRINNRKLSKLDENYY